MKGISREESLKRQISTMKEVCEKRKWMRVRKTLFILSIVIYLGAFKYGEMNSIIEYLKWLVIAPIVAVIVMFVSLLVLLYIIAGASEDEKYIAKLEGELKNEQD